MKRASMYINLPIYTEDGFPTGLYKSKSFIMLM